MNGTNDILNSLPILDGKNWIRLRKHMQSLFGFHETLEVVTNDVHELVDNATDAQRVANKETKKKDCKVAYCIQSAVDSTNFNKITHVESEKEAWDIFVKYYERGEKVKVDKLQTLRQQYDLLQMGEDKKIAVIHQSNNLETLKLKDLVGSLEAREIRIVERKGVQDSIQVAKNCWYNKYKGTEKGKEEIGNLARQNSYDSEDMMVMGAVADDYVDSKIWFLDLGCSNHMTSQKVWLADFDSSKKSKVKLDDNRSLQAEGTSDIVIQKSNGGKSMIKDVLYVPGMKCNMLSVGQLVEKGFSVIIKD
ncbi:uncharacterized protein LOC127137902 [Lathyrus oleraceus]|uniref:uncharacterized protein LOC127137902 n=1 Tax=Pisum sativum TaxID=3888 RepID=UPI0021D017C1|nr:uncharacterized protein LOC127137902 [Pisum sativum]